MKTSRKKMAVVFALTLIASSAFAWQLCDPKSGENYVCVQDSNGNWDVTNGQGQPVAGMQDLPSSEANGFATFLLEKGFQTNDC